MSAPDPVRFGQAHRLVKEALHLLRHGECAPGGTEMWGTWAAKAEAWLRHDMCPGCDNPAAHGEKWCWECLDEAAAEFADPVGRAANPRLTEVLYEAPRKTCRKEWPPLELAGGVGHFHRCYLRRKHAGACRCHCGMEVLLFRGSGARTRYSPDEHDRIPTFKIRDREHWTALPDTGLEILLLSFGSTGSTDGAWAHIQVREVQS